MASTCSFWGSAGPGTSDSMRSRLHLLVPAGVAPVAVAVISAALPAHPVPSSPRAVFMLALAELPGHRSLAAERQQQGKHHSADHARQGRQAAHTGGSGWVVELLLAAWAGPT